MLIRFSAEDVVRGVVPLKFSLMVPHGKLDACIALLEDGLRCMAPTPYHQVLTRDFLHHTERLGEWIAEFYRQADAAAESGVRRPVLGNERVHDQPG